MPGPGVFKLHASICVPLACSVPWAWSTIDVVHCPFCDVNAMEEVHHSILPLQCEGASRTREQDNGAQCSRWAMSDMDIVRKIKL